MEKYLEQLKAMGVLSVKEIKAGSIKTAPWVAFKCQYGCEVYGKLCCPPNAPSYKQTQEIIDCYEKAILFNSNDMSIINNVAAKITRELFFDGYYKAIGFGVACGTCEVCNGKKCNFPAKAIPCIEGCGIDVFDTARLNGFEINTLKKEDTTPTFYGVILVE